MITNTIGQLTELQANGGGYFTESFPTNFHHFYKRKVLVGTETAAMFKDVTASEKATIEARDAKWVEPSASLIERAEACGVVYNRKTGFFEHNGIVDLTAAEVSDMLAHVNAVFIPNANCLSGLKARTNVVTKTTSDNGITQLRLDGVCYANNSIMVLNVGSGIVSPESSMNAFARYCPILNTIIGELDVRYVTTINATAFGRSQKLREFRIKSLKTSLNLGDNPLLSLATLQYLVNNAANTTAITVTVHPQVYAKLTDESNAEWHAVLTAAEAKNINFATTE